MDETGIITRMDRMEGKLDSIHETIKVIAVQDQRIKSLEAQNRTIFDKLNELTNPKDGTIQKIQAHQASCPRSQMKFLWTIVVGEILALIALVSVRVG